MQEKLENFFASYGRAIEKVDVLGFGGQIVLRLFLAR